MTAKNLATLLVDVPKKLWRTLIALRSNVSIAKLLVIVLVIVRNRVRIDSPAVIASTLRSESPFFRRLLI